MPLSIEKGEGGASERASERERERETIMSLALIKLMPKRRHICPELIHMLTTRCLNNIIDTFMRGYSSLALTSPSPLTKNNEKKKLK